MKHILDSDFRYRPSFDTDIKKTFEKIRRQQQVKEQQLAKTKAQSEVTVKVVKLDQLKKVSST
jgi:hypothetical protein